MSKSSTGKASRNGATSLSRRRLLQGGAAVGGLAVGSRALSGFPTIWAQNIKDITLRHAGPPVAAIPKIAEQASKDLGFTISMQATENADLLNRFLSQSSAIDVGDVNRLYEVPGRAQRAAGDPAQQGQGLGQDHPALYEGHLPGRRRSLDAGGGAVHGPIRDRTGRTEIRQRPERIFDRSPDDHQCRYARYPSRSGRASDQQLGRSAEP